MTAVSFRCPHCNSMNIDPSEALWRCRDCSKTFEAAAVQVFDAVTTTTHPRQTRRALTTRRPRK